jgi:hypothetical protein
MCGVLGGSAHAACATLSLAIIASWTRRKRSSCHLIAAALPCFAASFRARSIGAVVALSAVLLGGQSLYFLAFPRVDDATGGFCAAGE